MDEPVEKGVEIVWRGGEIEPGRVVKLGVDDFIKLGHPGDGLGLVGEGGAEDADRASGLGDFDGVVDVRDNGPALGAGEVGMGSDAEAESSDFDVGAVGFVGAAGDLDLGADAVCIGGAQELFERFACRLRDGDLDGFGRCDVVDERLDPLGDSGFRFLVCSHFSIQSYYICDAADDLAHVLASSIEEGGDGIPPAKAEDREDTDGWVDRRRCRRS